VDGDSLTFSILADPTNGVLGAVGTPSCSNTVPNNCSAQVTYTPNPNFVGVDSFTFIADDTVLTSSPAIVSVTTVDTTPPSVTIAEIISPVTVFPTSLRGTAEPNSIISAFIEDDSVSPILIATGSTTADSITGLWIAPMTLELSALTPDGVYTAVADATDPAGNTSSPPIKTSFTLVTQPAPEIISIVASDPNVPAVPGFSARDTITVTFSEPTNRPLASTKADIDNLFEFLAILRSNNDYVGTWTSAATLVITIISVGSAGPQPGTFTMVHLQ